MKLAKVYLNKLSFLGVCLGLIVFSINYKFFGFLRLLDLIVIILFALFFFIKPKIENQQLVIFLFIIFILVLSTYIGILKNGPIELSRLVFIYKYLFIFLLPWLIVSIIKTKRQIEIINKLILINFIVLSCWAWLYVCIKYSGYIKGQIRPSFPTLDFSQKSDAHIYSSYLGFFLSVYFLYLKNFFNHSLFLSFSIGINGLLGLLMTGGRTGILLIVITFLVISILKFKNYFKLDYNFTRKIFNQIFCTLLVLIFLIIYFYFYQLDIFRAIEYLASRSLDFNILNDPSSLSRITKFVESFKEVSYLGGLLGHGLKSERIWYDGIFSMLMAHGGLSIILLFIIFYYSIIKRIYFNISNSRNSVILLFLIGLYFLSNLITEHVMVSRNAFPVLVFLSTLYVSIKNKISSSKL